MLDHEMGHLLDRDVRPKRAGARPHYLLDGLFLFRLKLLGPKQAQYHSLVVDDNTCIPSCRRDAFANLMYRFVQPAGRHISSSHVARTRVLRVRALRRKARGQPVEFSVYVVIDVGEAEALEPPRGPGTEISG